MGRVLVINSYPDPPPTFRNPVSAPAHPGTGYDMERSADLRIDTGGWSVICCAIFNQVPAKCSLANYNTLYVIK